MLVTARPVGVLVSTPSLSDPDVDTPSGQFVQSSGNFSNGSSEPVDGDDDEFVLLLGASPYIRSSRAGYYRRVRTRYR